MMDEEVGRQLVGKLERVYERYNIRSLDPDLNPAGPMRERASQVNDTIDAWLRGMDTEWTDYVPTLTVTKDKGVKKFAIREVKHKRLVADDLESTLRGMGDDVWDLAQQMRRSLNQRWVRMFGNDELFETAGRFEVDEAKVLGVFRGTSNNQFTGYGRSKSGAFSLNKDQGGDVVARLLGADMAKAIEDGLVSPEQYLSMIRQVAEAPIKNAQTGRSFYMPRNLIHVFGAESNPMDLRAINETRRFIATHAAKPRRANAALWDPDDLERYAGRFGRTDAMTNLIEEQNVAMRAAGGEAMWVHQLNGFRSATRYLKDTGQSWAMFVRSSADTPGVDVARRQFNDWIAPKTMEGIRESQEGLKRTGMWGRETMADVLFEQMSGLKDSEGTRFMRESMQNIVIPRITGRLSSAGSATAYLATLKAKQGLRYLLDTGVESALRRGGKVGEETADKLGEWANLDTPLRAGRGLSTGMARYLYVTHLGANLASVTLNAMQPWLLGASWMGSRSILKGYAKALPELLTYMKDRIGRYGIGPLDDATHKALVRKHFKFADIDGDDLLHIGRDSYESIDQLSFSTTVLGRAGRRERVLLDYPMKAFEKAEWLNRSVMAHATEDAYRRAGRQVVNPSFDAAGNVVRGNDEYYRMMGDVERMVSETQFGGHALNTPLYFQDPKNLLANPLMRQFMTFPVRSVTGLMVQSSRMGARENAALAVGHDFLRGMGISAVIYETTKGLIGADLSRGLFASATTDLFGGERFLEDGNEWIPVPPALDIPFDAIRTVASKEVDFFREVVPRTLPGGIAVSRAMGMLPKTPETPFAGLPFSMQKTYVDYDNVSPDGRVAIHKADHSIVDWQPPALVMAKALGMDLGKYKNSREIDQFLVKNRDEIVDFRRRAISAMLSNNMPKAEGIRREFEKRFGMKLTVSKRQVQEAIRLRAVPRSERILDRLPPEARPAYARVVAQSDPRRFGGVSPEQLTEAATSRQRARANKVLIEPDVARRLQELVREKEEADKAGTAFQAFGQYQ
jgi:hypothetical protein